MERMKIVTVEKRWNNLAAECKHKPLSLPPRLAALEQGS